MSRVRPEMWGVLKTRLNQDAFQLNSAKRM